MPLVITNLEKITTDLEKTLGIEYEFKLRLKEYFKELCAVTIKDLQDAYLIMSPPDYYYENLSAIYSDPNYVFDYFLTAPSLGFSAKETAYKLFQEINDFLLEVCDAEPAIPLTLRDEIYTNYLIGNSKYVGIEGEGDYHFMDYIYRWALKILELAKLIP